MRTDPQGGGTVLASALALLLLLPTLPFVPFVIAYVRIRDARERRAELRAVAGV